MLSSDPEQGPDKEAPWEDDKVQRLVQSCRRDYPEKAGWARALSLMTRAANHLMSAADMLPPSHHADELRQDAGAIFVSRDELARDLRDDLKTIDWERQAAERSSAAKTLAGHPPEERW